MKFLFKLTFFIFISLNIFPSELDLQDSEKKAGDVLRASEWNSIIAKLESSAKQIKESMLIGSWSCSSEELTGYSSSNGWVEKTDAQFTRHTRSNFPITFQASTASSNGTWTSTEDYFFDSGALGTNGYFLVLYNNIYLTFNDDTVPTRSYTLTFHGEARFSATKNREFGGSLDNFSCDKQS
tara:strand:+ start:91 stop:636 length:546 start_codon:yes stop_codon:yes gene_type:complete